MLIVIFQYKFGNEGALNPVETDPLKVNLSSSIALTLELNFHTFAAPKSL
jgi:hypothetical protein